MGRDGDVDVAAGEGLGQELCVPCLKGLPAGGSGADDEGCVAGDISHELERAGLLVEFLDDGGVKLIVGDDELGDWVVW